MTDFTVPQHVEGAGREGHEDKKPGKVTSGNANADRRRRQANGGTRQENQKRARTHGKGRVETQDILDATQRKNTAGTTDNRRRRGGTAEQAIEVTGGTHRRRIAKTRTENGSYHTHRPLTLAVAPIPQPPHTPTVKSPTASPWVPSARMDEGLSRLYRVSILLLLLLLQL